MAAFMAGMGAVIATSLTPESVKATYGRTPEEVKRPVVAALRRGLELGLSRDQEEFVREFLLKNSATRANFQIRCDGEVIGSFALERRDARMGTATADLDPGLAYEKLRSISRLFTDQGAAVRHDSDLHARTDRKRDSLNLTVTTPEGVLLPASVVRIAQTLQDLYDDSFEVEVYFRDV